MDKIKCIGISDWRIQPLELIDEIIIKEKPDLILYGGDDLSRFASFNSFEGNISREIPYKTLKEIIGNWKERLSKEKFLMIEFIQKFDCLNEKEKVIQLRNLKKEKQWKLPYYSVVKNINMALKGKDILKIFEIKIKQFEKNIGIYLEILDFLKENINSILTLNKNIVKLQYKGKNLQLKIALKRIIPSNTDILNSIIKSAIRELQNNSDEDLMISSQSPEIELLEDLDNDLDLLEEEKCNLEQIINIINRKTNYKKIVKKNVIDCLLKGKYRYHEQVRANFKNISDRFTIENILENVDYNIFWNLDLEVLESEKEDPIVRWCQSLPKGFYYVLGNDDEKYFRLQKPALFLEEYPIIIGNWVILGISGSPDSHPIGYTLFNEEKMLNTLKDIVQKYRDKNIIIVSHTPPYGILDLSVRFGIEHIGSTALKEIVETNPNIKLVICGHSHLWNGMINQINNTRIVNISNHDDNQGRSLRGFGRRKNPVKNVGNYIAVTIKDDDLEIEVKKVGCEWEKVLGIGDKRSFDFPLLLQPLKSLNLDHIPKMAAKRLELYIAYLQRGEKPITDLLVRIKHPNVKQEDNFTKTKGSKGLNKSNRIYALDFKADPSTNQFKLASITTIHKDPHNNKELLYISNLFYSIEELLRFIKIKHVELVFVFNVSFDSYFLLSYLRMKNIQVHFIEFEHTTLGINFGLELENEEKLDVTIMNFFPFAKTTLNLISEALQCENKIYPNLERKDMNEWFKSCSNEELEQYYSQNTRILCECVYKFRKLMYDQLGVDFLNKRIYNLTPVFIQIYKNNFNMDKCEFLSIKSNNGPMERNIKAEFIDQVYDLESITEDSIFLDIETESIGTIDKNEYGEELPAFIASISLIHLKNKTEKTFLCTNYKTQKSMIEKFKLYISKYKGKIYAWTPFDEKILKAHGFNRAITDLKTIVEHNVILPNYALKDVEKYLGIERSNDISSISGAHIGVMVSHVLKEEVINLIDIFEFVAIYLLFFGYGIPIRIFPL